MTKKNSNKILLIVLLAFIGVLIIVKVVNLSGKDKNFKSQFGELDTTDIAQILIYPKVENGEEMKFYMQDSVWIAEKDGKIFQLRENTVENFITDIKTFKPTRLAAKTQEKWADYQLNDSLGTRLIVKNSEGENTLDLMIGKFSVKQNQNQNQYQQGGQMNIEGITYVREYDEDEIYAIDGFVAFTFNQKFDSFRESSLVKSQKENMTKLQFEYGDSSFIAIKQDSLWLVNDKVGENAKFDSYLTSISNKSGQTFDDEYVPIGNPVYTLKISGDNMTETKIEAFLKDSANYIIHSNYNQEAYFIANKTFVDGIFKSEKYFTGK
jgi:hypothetical protein